MEEEPKLKETITQGNLETWLALIRVYKPKGVTDAQLFTGATPLPEHFGVATRAAIDAGWFSGNGLKVQDVPDMDPKIVAKLGKAVWEKYVEVTTFDPNA